MSFSFDDRDIERLEDDLGKFKKTAVPDATRETLTRAAFRARLFAQQGIARNMILKNKFTAGSVRAVPARGRIIPRQMSIVGSVAPYMADQEFGKTKAKKGKHGVDLPTSFSAGQGMKKRPRTKLPRKRNKSGGFQLRSGSGGVRSRKQQNIIRTKEAAKRGGGVVFMNLGRKKGLFRIKGGKRKPNVKMIHDLSEQSVTIPRNPWLRPAFNATQKTIPAIYKGQLQFQVRKKNLFR